MSFDKLILKVKQAESALEDSERRTAARWNELKLAWTEAWTPGRIVIAGLVSGFVVGRGKPVGIASGGGVLNLLTALGGIFASGNAQAAAKDAERAADAAPGQPLATPTAPTPDASNA